MTNIIKTSFVGFIISLIVSCAAMSKEECEQTHWKNKGLEDGRSGISAGRLEDYQKACDEPGIEPDEQNYKAGHKAGTAEFCRVQKGYAYAEVGSLYRSQCEYYNYPTEGFLRGYQLGREVYEYKYEHKKAEESLEKIDSKIDEFEQTIQQQKSELSNSELSESQRAFHTNTILTNTETLSDLKEKRYQQLGIVDKRRKELQEVRESHRAKGYCGENTCFIGDK